MSYVFLNVRKLTKMLVILTTATFYYFPKTRTTHYTFFRITLIGILNYIKDVMLLFFQTKQLLSPKLRYRKYNMNIKQTLRNRNLRAIFYLISVIKIRGFINASSALRYLIKLFRYVSFWPITN